MIFKKDKLYPDAFDIKRVGNYPALVQSGGGYFYDEVLEYRVWVRPPGKEPFYFAFANFEEALNCSKLTQFAEMPVVLVSQEEYIDEPEVGNFIHIKKPRLTEWEPEWLVNSKGTKKNIPKFLKNEKK